MAGGCLEKLNPQQRRAVEHGGRRCADARPLLVIAGAGSGKTNTLAHRVAHLIVERRRSAPHPAADLLAPRRRRDGAAGRAHRCSGARRRSARAARRADLGRHLPRASARGSCASTPSASGSTRLHHPRPRGFRRPDEPRPARARLLANREALSRPRAPALRSIRAPSTPRRRSRRCWRRLSRGAPTGQRELQAAVRRLCRGQAAPERARLRRSAALLGADDGGAGARRARSAARFDHVLVDEYQDTNRLQASILLALKPDGRGLTVVGDDAQSIYSFRAATVRNILDFPGALHAARARSSRWSATTARRSRSSPRPTP